MELINFTEKGICCNPGGFYIDPWKPVKTAVITHAHSDHARWGMGEYISQETTTHILKCRLGKDISVHGFQYSEPFEINGVKISFHPAGHVAGSAQVRVEYQGEVWVISGDYKLANDNISTPFEVVSCDAFVTESTFGLPIYQWNTNTEIFDEINEWWRKNNEEEMASVICGYALGKAQRILQNVDQSIGKIFTHGAVENLCKVIEEAGIKLPHRILVTKDVPKSEYKGSLIIAPPSALGSPWLKKFQPYSIAIASGWMAIRGARRRRAADRGFALSDHADWNDLNRTVKACGAKKVLVTHGYTSVFSNWLREQGYDAYEVKTDYQGELGELNESELQSAPA